MAFGEFGGAPGHVQIGQQPGPGGPDQVAGGRGRSRLRTRAGTGTGIGERRVQDHRSQLPCAGQRVDRDVQFGAEDRRREVQPRRGELRPGVDEQPDTLLVVQHARMKPGEHARQALPGGELGPPRDVRVDPGAQHRPARSDGGLPELVELGRDQFGELRLTPVERPQQGARRAAARDAESLVTREHRPDLLRQPLRGDRGDRVQFPFERLLVLLRLRIEEVRDVRPRPGEEGLQYRQPPLAHRLPDQRARSAPTCSGRSGRRTDQPQAVGDVVQRRDHEPGVRQCPGVQLDPEHRIHLRACVRSSSNHSTRPPGGRFHGSGPAEREPARSEPP